jgi:hypothetical protein
MSEFSQILLDDPDHFQRTCCERRLLSIFTTGSVRVQWARVAYNGATWRCPECRKLWRHVCGAPCGWEEVA